MTTVYTFDEDCISDFHKDAYGFRPSQGYFESWNQMTDDQKQTEWDYLLTRLEDSNKQFEEYQKQAIDRFVKLVEATINNGASDVQTAHRWIMEASDSQGDWEFLCYNHGLPYGYFKSSK